MKYRYLLVTILLNITFFLSGMEMPQPQRVKRGLERTVEPESKLQKLQWHQLDSWLIRLPEEERLVQFEQMLKQIPPFIFWSWEGTTKIANTPDPSILQAASEVWKTMREVLINQMNAASPQLKTRLAQLALANQDRFGTGSLIAYFATALAFQPDDIDLAKLLKPIIATLIANANPEQQFEATYSVIKLGIMDPAIMFQALTLLSDSGINLCAKERNGKTILDYFAENKIPMADQLPLEQLQGFITCESLFRG